MASKTQLRLGQLTGSFADRQGGIVDNLGANSAANLLAMGLTSGSMVGVLSEMASAIKRIHGGGTFAALAEGVFDLDTMSLQSSATTDPLLEIKNTTNDANGARLRFVKDKGAAGAANDVNGLIEFFGDDASQDQVKFSEIKSQVAVHTNGQEGGKLTLSVASHNGTLTQGLLISDGDAAGELDVTIAGGSSSVTTVAGVLKLTGNTIQASDGGTSITLDTSDNVTIGNNLRVNGNVIQNSEGTATMTMDTDEKVTIAGDLTVSGNDLDFAAGNANIGASVGANELTLGGDSTNVIVAGNLSVAGTTTTVNSTNVTIHDKFLALAGDAVGANTDSGIIFTSGSNVTARPDVIIGKINGSNNSFGVGAVASHSGSIANSSTANFTDISWRAASLEVKANTNKIQVNDDAPGFKGNAALQITTANHLNLNAGNGKDISLSENGTGKGLLLFSSNDLIVSGGHSGGSLAFESNSGTINVNQLGQLGATLKSDLNNAQFVISGAQGNDVILGSTSHTFFNIEETQVGGIGGSSTELILSSSGTRNITFRPGGGQVVFQDVLGSPGTKLQIDVKANDNARVLVDNYRFLNFDSTLSAPVTTISGSSLVLHAGGTSGRIKFREADANGSNSVTLAGPASTGDITLTLPSSVGGNGEALVSNGAGVLSFSAIGGAGIKKAARIIGAAGIASGANVDLATANIDAGTQPDDLRSLAFDRSDVFVNGQLLLSGTDVQVGTGAVDYTAVVGQARRLKFGFALEADDIVTIVTR